METPEAIRESALCSPAMYLAQLKAGVLCRELLPAVVFCFSKKRVDFLADMLPNLDFTTPIEKSRIHVFFDKAVSRLKGTDKELPQIVRVKEMLKRGIGVHHAGEIPLHPPCP